MEAMGKSSGFGWIGLVWKVDWWVWLPRWLKALGLPAGSRLGDDCSHPDNHTIWEVDRGHVR